MKSPANSPRQEKEGPGDSQSKGDQSKAGMWRRDPQPDEMSALDVDYFFQTGPTRPPAGSVISTARTGVTSEFHTSLTGAISPLDSYHRPDSPARSISPLTGRSVASLATNVLLGDTQDVVEAISNKKRNKNQDRIIESRPYNESKSEEFIRDPESDSENGSFFAIVDGHGHWRANNSSGNASLNSSLNRTHSSPAGEVGYTVEERPPRPAVGGRSVNGTVRSTSHPNPALTKPLTSKPKEKTYIVNKPSRTYSSDFDNSIASDGPSECDSILSTSTDYSAFSETASPKMSRKGSGGKGPISITRTNRAFALRRARADSDTEGAPKVGPGRPGSAGRPTSAGANRSSSGAPRTRPVSAQSNTARSDASLGAAIVKKSRENARAPAPKRTDSGLGSRAGNLKSQGRSLSTSSSVSRQSPDPRELRSKSATPKAMSRGGMTVMGSANKSQPNSRSNSPKSEEYSAWKRRKNYDPRQAALDAKVNLCWKFKVQIIYSKILE